MPPAPPDDRAARLGAISAELGGDRGALDAALVAGAAGAARGWTLLARHAFDFNRRLGSVLVDGPEGHMLIAKGAPEAMIPLCTSMRTADRRAPDGARRTRGGPGAGPGAGRAGAALHRHRLPAVVGRLA